MKRLLKNENGTLLFQMANHAKIGLETKGSLEKKSTKYIFEKSLKNLNLII